MGHGEDGPEPDENLDNGKKESEPGEGGVDEGQPAAWETKVRVTSDRGLLRDSDGDGAGNYRECGEFTYVNLENVGGITKEVCGWFREDVKENTPKYNKRTPYSKNDLSGRDIDKAFGDKFVDTCDMLLTAMLEARADIYIGNEEHFRKDMAVILIYQLGVTILRQFNATRHTGQGYVSAHLVGLTEGTLLEKGGRFDDNLKYIERMGAAMIIVKVFGMCGIVSTIGTFSHDDTEDCDISPEEIIDESLWKHRLEDPDEGKIQRLRDQVASLVNGVTKVGWGEDRKKAEEEFGVPFRDGKEASFYKEIHGCVYGDIRTFIVRLADRLNNVMTLHGHGNKDKRGRIAQETSEVHLRIVRKCQFVECERYMVDAIARESNPEMSIGYYNSLAESEKAWKEKPRSWLKSNLSPEDRQLPLEELVRKDILGGAGVSDNSVLFRPNSLSDYTQRSDKGLGAEDTSLRDLKIGSLDPMREIVVTVDDVSQIGNVETGIVGALDMSDVKTRDYCEQLDESDGHWRYPVSSQLAGVGEKIRRKVGDQYSACDDRSLVVDSGRGKAKPSFVQRGRVITGFSRKYRKLMVIRINDEKSENRLKRGIMSDLRDSDSPPDVIAMMTYLIKYKKENPDVNILEFAKQGPFRPRTQFYTPFGDLRLVPQGISKVEAVMYVHPNFALGLQGVERSDSLISDGGKYGRRIFESVDFVPEHSSGDVPVYTFDSNLADNREFSLDDVRWRLEACPGWLVLFKEMDTKMKLKEVLADPCEYFKVDEKSDRKRRRIVFEKGEDYIDRLKGILGVPIKKHLLSQLGSSLSMDQIVEGVGSGDIDAFGLMFRNLSFEKEKLRSVTISVDFSEDEDEAYLIELFRKVGLDMGLLSRFGPGGRRQFKVIPLVGRKNFDFVEFGKCLLEMSYYCDIKVTGGIELKSKEVEEA